jgi:hypothetical protein
MLKEKPYYWRLQRPPAQLKLEISRPSQKDNPRRVPLNRRLRKKKLKRGPPLKLKRKLPEKMHSYKPVLVWLLRLSRNCKA